ncbi:MAG: hypothetical protein AAGF67_16210, partial [Verrucomicrobiota bacterium]
MRLLDDRTNRRTAFAGCLFFFALCFLVTPSAKGQIFGGDGLFNRKTEAPRAETQDQIGIPTPVTGRVEVLKGTEATFE